MPDSSRRHFLRISLIAAGAFAGAEKIGAKPVANDRRKLRVAIVGAGKQGIGHVINWLRQADCEIAAICDPDRGKTGRHLKRIKAAYQNAGKPAAKIRVCADMREVLDDASIDAVSMATPNHWHALGGIWAMQAGKDVYVEKPVCQNIAEGTALVAAADKYNRICQVGTQCRSSVAVQDAIAFMNRGGIGEVMFARGLCYKRRPSIGPLGDYKIPGSVDFNLWSGPAPYTTPKLTRKNLHYDWHFQRLYGNGDLGSQGPHQTDIARWGLGLNRHPNSVFSYGGRLGYQAERKDPNYIDAGDTANTCVSIFDYGDKCIVFEVRGLDVTGSDDTEINRLFQRGRNAKGQVVGVIFYGSEGYVVQQNYDYCTAWDRHFKKIKEFRGENDHFANFVTACRSGDRNDLRADIQEGHLSAAMTHLGNISYQLGERNRLSVPDLKLVLSEVGSRDDNAETLQRTVQHLTKNGVDLNATPLSAGPVLQFDPQQEIFPDSAEATALCQRTYREGFKCPTAEEIRSA